MKEPGESAENAIPAQEPKDKDSKDENVHPVTKEDESSEPIKKELPELTIHSLMGYVGSGRFIEGGTSKSDKSRMDDENGDSSKDQIDEESTRNVKTELLTPDELIAHEKKVANEILGADIEVAPLPGVLTPEKRKELADYGFELMYIPLGLINKEALGKKGDGKLENYLEELDKRCPKWRDVESLSDEEKEDLLVPRRYEKWIFEAIRDGKIDFPKSGHWVAIEKLKQAELSETLFEPSQFSRDIGIQRILTDNPNGIDIPVGEARGKTSLFTINDAIAEHKQEILEKLGLTGHADIRLPELFEANYAFNRMDLGVNGLGEWTNSTYKNKPDEPDDLSFRVVTGNTQDGGAGSWDRVLPETDNNPSLRWRAIITFD